ncbi:MAG: BLUF domain-containing protein [Betaproteobacteria bacterium]|nr:BLUF domain-containing protein [Betaproteobacteria bacterium]
MLVRLLYASRAIADVSQDELFKILNESKANNPGVGITGVLCSSGRIYMQVLEGGRAQVSALYNRIASDRRHQDVVILSYEEISERKFVGWSMGLVNLERINPSLLLKYSACATLDPYGVSGKASLAMFDELMATASIMGQASGSSPSAR